MIGLHPFSNAPIRGQKLLSVRSKSSSRSRTPVPGRKSGIVSARPSGFEPLTYGSGARLPEIDDHEHANFPSESVYSVADEMPVPALSHDREQLRAELERVAAAGDWSRVGELARLLALA
jgi:hypothetical protein